MLQSAKKIESASKKEGACKIFNFYDKNNRFLLFNNFFIFQSDLKICLKKKKKQLVFINFFTIFVIHFKKKNKKIKIQNCEINNRLIKIL